MRSNYQTKSLQPFKKYSVPKKPYTLEEIEALLRQKESSHQSIRVFWRGLVRDPDGKWLNYHKKGSKYFKYGHQKQPDLTDKTQIALLKATIRHKKAFLEGLKQQKYQDFRQWIIDLHNAQLYKGDGRLRNQPLVARGEHSQIAKNSVIQIAQEYHDPYANKATHLLHLEGIDPKGLPKDVWKNEDCVFHYYPDPQYYPQYFSQLRNLLDKIFLQLERPAGKQIITNIALYYQYGINMHMFEEVNQSLFANQANTLLMNFKLHPIGQEIMDFVAMRLQPVNFVKYFKDTVRYTQDTYITPQ